MRRTLLFQWNLPACFAWICLLCMGAAAPAWSAEDFPEPEAMKSAVAFWKRVYVEVTTDAGLLHDNEHLGVVYEVLRFDGKSGRSKEHLKDARRRHWQAALNRLATGGAPRTAAERSVLQAFQKELGRKPSARDLRAARERIRFQLGQRDKFRDGLIRSGAYEAAMRDVFRRAGLPEDLAYLPHVESSFNIRAYSKYGAAGAWQFMRSTGRQYMTVDYVVDERLDPMVATQSAARLLGENYAALGSWPLALTAYNHGRGGMLRAKRLHGDDIADIVRNYSGRTFGFASRNFYAQFLAARSIVREYESYFGQLARQEPEPIDEVELPFYADIDDVTRFLGVSEHTIRTYNPALRPPVFQSNKRIPKGYVLRLPAGTVGAEPDVWLASLPSDRRFAEQHRSRYYKVRPGDTLSAIARRHGTGVQTLVSINNIRGKHRIFAGQVLQLPDPRRRNERVTSPSFALVSSAQAATNPPTVPTPRPRQEREAAEPVLVAARIDVPKPRPEGDGPAPSAAPAPPKAAAPERAPEPARLPVAEVAQPEPEDVAEVALPDMPHAKPELPDDSPFREIKDDRIVVDSLETLGHYAEWLELPTQRLRSLNQLPYGRALRMGQRIRLDFSKVSRDTFVQRRTEFHKGIEEDFFGSFQITGVVEHRIKPGDTIWKISNRTYEVPTWLIHRYNPEANLSRLTPGVRLVIPQIEPLVNG